MRVRILAIVGMLYTGASALAAANVFFVTFPVQAPAGASGQDAQAAAAAGVTLVRDQIPGEPAYHLSGSGAPGAGPVFTRPGSGSYALTDAGSQWISNVNQGQLIRGWAEAYAGQFGWQGKAFVGALQGTVEKSDVVSSRLSLPPVLLSELPTPHLLSATASQISLGIPVFVDASGLASGLVLWRRESAGSWAKRADLVLGNSEIAFNDNDIIENRLYWYGISARYPWPGGSQGGALPLEVGSWVSFARSESSLMKASDLQPSPTAFPTLPESLPTPDLGSESWLAYPNPNRSGKMRLAFQIAKKSTYRVEVFGIDGSRVHSSLGEASTPGWQLPWVDLTKLASGIYLMKLSVKPEGEVEYSPPIRKVAIVR